MKKSSKEQSETAYEEVTITCTGCGKKRKIVKLKSRKIDDFLCQRCGKN